MSNLRSLIKKHLLVEKRIGQLLANFTVTYAFDIDKKTHADDRKTREYLDDYNQKEITNGEIKYAIDLVKREIAEKINDGEIEHDVAFVIRSIEKELAMTLVPHRVTDKYWKLLVTTLFRESKHNRFKIGKDQVVIDF